MAKNYSKNSQAGQQTSTINRAAVSRADREKDFGKFDFVKHAPIMGGISLVLTLIAIALLMTKGLNYGIDFAGGTEIQVRFAQPVEQSAVRAAIEEVGIHDPSVQTFGSASEYLIRLELPKGHSEKETNTLINADVTKVRGALKSKFQLPDDGLLRVDTVGPAVGSELMRNGLLAAFYSFIVIMIYVALRFDYNYAPGAVLCLVHDSIVTVGVFSLLGREFNTQIMAAVLTLIGYSLNDTIVTFDRIRETAPKNRDLSMRFIINKSVNDMLGRTILTSSATMIAVLALYFLGGGVISEIAFTLIIGILIGTYSSIYVASPLILVMQWFKGRTAAPLATGSAAGTSTSPTPGQTPQAT
jgi:preprotein translocase subunit SecF